jgi:hypothetical protein
VKACLTFDPWFFVHDKDIFDGNFKLNVPLIMINTDHFGEGFTYKCLRGIEKFG